MERIYKFKADNKNVNFPTQFFLGSISKKFGVIDSREGSLKENMCDFLVDYNAFDQSNILKIHKYLLIKNKISNFWVF